MSKLDTRKGVGKNALKSASYDGMFFLGRLFSIEGGIFFLEQAQIFPPGPDYTFTPSGLRNGLESIARASFPSSLKRCRAAAWTSPPDDPNWLALKS